MMDKTTDKATEYAKELGKLSLLQIRAEDNGLLTLSFQIDFGGEAQGGYVVLDAWDKAKNRRVGTAHGTDMILRFLRLFRVPTLDAAVGRPVYALYSSPKRHNDVIRGLEVPPFDGGGRVLLEER